MRRPATLFVLLLFIGCGGRQAVTDPSPEPETSLLDLWAGLDEAFTALGNRAEEVCDTSFATWFADFGTRGLACAAAQVVSPTSFLGRAPVVPFERGPHTASAEAVRLDLDSPRDFGHYDPAFVRWVTEHAIPAPGNAAARTLTPADLQPPRSPARPGSTG